MTVDCSDFLAIGASVPRACVPVSRVLATGLPVRIEACVVPIEAGTGDVLPKAARWRCCSNERGAAGRPRWATRASPRCRAGAGHCAPSKEFSSSGGLFIALAFLAAVLHVIPAIFPLFAVFEGPTAGNAYFCGQRALFQLGGQHGRGLGALGSAPTSTTLSLAQSLWRATHYSALVGVVAQDFVYADGQRHRGQPSGGIFSKP